MAGQVRIGIVGTSWWSDIFYCSVLQPYERANLQAICGRNQNRANEIATKHAIPQVYGDYRQMIRDGDLDAIIVATPDDTHYEIVMAALDAGLHVLCEKPVALNAAHALEMFEKAKSANVKHMVLYTWHWMPAMQRLKQLIDEDYLGQVYHAYFHWNSHFGRSKEYRWRGDADRCNGVFGDLGSHMLHLVYWFMGDISSVYAQFGFHVQRNPLEGKPHNPANDSAHVSLEMVNGAIVQVQLSGVRYTSDPNSLFTIELCGEKGTLKADVSVGFQFKTTLYGQQDGTDATLFEEDNFNLAEFVQTQPIGSRLFVDCILDDKAISPGLFEGYKIQQVIDAGMRSHQTGTKIPVSNSPLPSG